MHARRRNRARGACRGAGVNTRSHLAASHAPLVPSDTDSARQSPRANSATHSMFFFRTSHSSDYTHRSVCVFRCVCVCVTEQLGAERVFACDNNPLVLSLLREAAAYASVESRIDCLNFDLFGKQPLPQCDVRTNELIHERILTLPHFVRFWPPHSACFAHIHMPHAPLPLRCSSLPTCSTTVRLRHSSAGGATRRSLGRGGRGGRGALN